jgi:hypothetical protein
MDRFDNQRRAIAIPHGGWRSACIPRSGLNRR